MTSFREDRNRTKTDTVVESSSEEAQKYTSGNVHKVWVVKGVKNDESGSGNGDAC